jgi:filamentous hemagglutinin family protein
MAVAKNRWASERTLPHPSGDRLAPPCLFDRRRTFRGLFATATAIAAVMALPRYGVAGPTGGTVVAGSAAISQSGNTTNINQSTNQAVINWLGFSIAPSQTVNFNQPSSASATLNRVIGNEQSVIAGALNANGQVFIVNSAGVIFTKGSQVNVGALVASTLDISNQNFMAQNYSFSGSSSASVVNQGRIHAGVGGYVALLGKTVSNDGVIVAKLGTVAMASGDKITLNFAGNSLVDVTIDQGTLNALVANKRAIIADGGRVILTAKAADQVLSAQVNNSGIIQARTMASLKGGAGTVQKGSIKLLAQGGTVSVSGKLDASAPKGGDGGAIETSGDKVKVADNAVITTKAANGQNGTWLIDPDGFTIAAIGGDISGTTLGRELTSTSVTIASTSGRGADGKMNVNDTVTWLSGTTLTLNATNAINVNTVISGPNGGLALNAGTDININAPSSLRVATLNATALAGDVNFNASQTFTGAGTWTFSGHNINVNDAVNWSAGTLTLNAGAGGGFINLNAPMTASGTANLVVTYNTGMDTTTDVNGKPTATYGTQFGGINPLFDPSTNTFLGYIQFTNTNYINSFPASATTSPLTINGQPYTLITSIGQPTLADGITPNPHDLSALNNSNGNFALAGNLDAGGIVNSHGNTSGTVYSAAPIGTFLGNLEGLGHTASNLVIVAPAAGNLGLIGTLGDGVNPTTVRNIGVVNVLIQDTLPGFFGGGSTDGALVGMVNNGIIVNAFATGNPNAQVPQGSAFSGPPTSPQPVTAAIAAGDTIGGLVGLNAGIIVNSHADVSVYGGNAGQDIGGLVGTNTRSGVLLNDSSSGTVSAGQPVDSGNLGNDIGGFVGYNNGGVISNSSTTSQVWSLNNNRVGGFVGQNALGGIINNGSSSGAVNIQWTLDQLGADGQFGGGFVGDNRGGTINNSFTSSNVTYPGFPTFADVGAFGGAQRPGPGGNDITTNSTATGTVNGQPGFAFYGTDSGTSTNVNVNPPGSSPPPGQGPPPPPPPPNPQLARSQAQTLTQQATAQQAAAGQAQLGGSAGTVASAAALKMAASPPSSAISAAGTAAATVPSAVTINANLRAIESNVQADDQRLRRRPILATTAPRRSSGGLGATIHSIEINGKRLQPEQRNDNSTPRNPP